MRMRAYLAILLLAGLVFSAMAELAFAGNLEIAVQKYLEPGMVIPDAIALHLSNGTAYLIPIDGQETLLIGNWSSEPVSDEGQILAILREGMINGANVSGAKSELAALIDGAYGVKGEPEGNCTRYTGMEKFPCFDRDSCNLAAQSSPQAQVMIQADGFWQAEVAWASDVKSLNASLAVLKSWSSSAGADAAFAGNISSKLAAAQSIMQEINSNRLMTDFAYCPKTPWPYSKISLAVANWNTVKTKLSALPAQDSRAHDIALRTRAWLDYTANKAPEFQKMKKNLNTALDAVSKRLNESAKNFTDDVNLSSKLSMARNDTKKALAAGDGEMFRVALAAQPQIISKIDAVNASIGSYLGLIADAKKRLATARLAYAKLLELGQNAKAAALNASISLQEGKLALKPKASELAGIAKSAKDLESEGLSAVAEASLGINNNDTENSSQQNHRQTLPANNTPANPAGGNETKPVLPKPPPLPCAIPGAVAAALISLMAISTNREKLIG